MSTTDEHTIKSLMAAVDALREERDGLLDRLSHVRSIVADDASRCVGCRHSAFPHRLSCDVLRTADLNGDYVTAAP